MDIQLWILLQKRWTPDFSISGGTWCDQKNLPVETPAVNTGTVAQIDPAVKGIRLSKLEVTPELKALPQAAAQAVDVSKLVEKIIQN
jgi:hypothetical protein